MRCGRCKEVFDASANLLADVRYSPVSQHKDEAAPVPVPSASAPVAPVAPQEPVIPPAPAPVAVPVVAPPPVAVEESSEPSLPAPPVAMPPPTVVVPPTPAASFPQHVPVPEERPNVWSNARASITGFSNASIQHLAQESGEGKSEPSPVAPAVAAPTRPWAGHYSAPSSPPQSGYGARRESNVVPPGWKPEVDKSKPVADEVADELDEKHVEPEFVSSRLSDDKVDPVVVTSVTSKTPEEEIVVPLEGTVVHAEPSLVADKQPTTVPRPALISQDPELLSQGADEDDEEDMPELTFEASRQHELVDEPVIVAERDPDEVAADKREEVAAAEAEPAERVEPTLDPVQDDAVTEKPQADALAAADAAESDDKTLAKTDEPEPEAAEQPLPVTPSEDEVGFMRDARRKAFWSKPAVRALLMLIVLGLLAGFAGQYAVAERNRLAAMYPALRPVLEKLCQPLNCEVGLPRQIASVAIDSSTFTRVRDDASSFNLQVALKSTADMVLEMPALELTLTDSSDQPVLRRVLKREDTNAPAELAAHGEWNGVVKLQVPEVADRVTGYRLLAFYP
ncbi:DUF3426 domain-containing protein [Diaphorobacter sp. HDW4B]|uniref:DUF3426 domain-containing protein n=1 Tax=Diaphorobacter sp. HDW4B TaxID=2714925 RepID=UPI001F0CF870|nr:DUF3426 domain-containing protein [Diaphorobacter sp. HDW4B]